MRSEGTVSLGFLILQPSFPLYLPFAFILLRFLGWVMGTVPAFHTYALLNNSLTIVELLFNHRLTIVQLLFNHCSASYLPARFLPQQGPVSLRPLPAGRLLLPH
jgi:hypothetical protein